jgi:(1->4)-alpha-D-glucan 1-alpha-D-glucosylmutase
MTLPRATIRLQLHRGFTFDDAAALVAYFAALGVSHLYLSPILTARAGSVHGYDVVDPTRVNPELGGEEALRRLVHELRRHGLGVIADIVPNHMAIGSSNPWWMDVLAHGQESRFAKYFDIDWMPEDPNLRGKVALPILGRPYGQALAAGEITLHKDKDGRGFVRYFEHSFPLSAASTAAPDQMSFDDFDPASAPGRERLNRLLDAQHYRLIWWRSANDVINWRRFFDINELAAIRVEDNEVFEAVHATIFRIYAEGLIDGLRIDHVDGLARPAEYCQKVRNRLLSLGGERPTNTPNGPPYLIVEKILGWDETLPADWQTDGTTGYDFMNEVSALQHDPRGEHPLSALWYRTSGRSSDFASEEELARRQIVQRSFAAQYDATVCALYQIAQSDLATRDISRSAIARCLTEMLSHFPVYRTYAQVDKGSEADKQFLERAIEGAKSTGLPSDRWLLDVLGGWLSGKSVRPDLDSLQAIALTRCQQLSAPLCAKAVEDTAFYRYGRLISRNDVGFDARLFSCPVAEFHQRMQARAEHFPHAMLTTATHDHKRGEDVRARLAVLSELAEEWSRCVGRWLELAAAQHRRLDEVPSSGDLAILFQTIVGAWPLALTVTDKDGLETYASRLAAWQQKAVREAKVFSDWSAPNETYERAAAGFIRSLFSEPSELLNELSLFAQRIAAAGAVNGLAQTLIKLTAPGIPDIYQGTEYWDLSLVDPDNRAPVAFEPRQRSLDHTAPADRASTWRDGHVKQAMIERVLAVQKDSPLLFSKGKYLPLATAGQFAENIVAFARTYQSSVAIVASIRWPTHVLDSDRTIAPTQGHWKGTRIVLPDSVLNVTGSSALHESKTMSFDKTLDAEEAFDILPVACLVGGKS